MSEIKNTELNEEQLSAVVGGGRKRTFGYEFLDPINKYALEGYIGKRVWYHCHGDGKDYETIVLNYKEDSEGCGTVRHQTLKIVYNCSDRTVCNYTKVFEGDDGIAYARIRLK